MFYSIIFSECSFKYLPNFFIKSFPQYKLCKFSTLSNVHIVTIKCPQEICFLIFVVQDFLVLFANIVDIKYSPVFVSEDFAELFAHPSIF